jgi:hypothetical protein
MTTEIVPQNSAAALERALIEGDLSRLTEEQRVEYYQRVCESLGLNPLTRPFEYLRLNGRLILYATRAAADQLRAIKRITITALEPRQVGDLYVVVATGRDASGREDSATGAVAIKGLTGDALANAMMRAETKAKRRLTLSLAGLGWTDESEVDAIPGAERVAAERPSLAERVAQRVAALPEPAASAAEEGMTVEAFVAAVKGLDSRYVAAVRDAMFPGVGSVRQLTPAQRAALARELLDADESGQGEAEPADGVLAGTLRDEASGD